jgi:very-short-patch-repair endonuclease
MIKLSQSTFYLPYNPKLVERAKQLRKNSTPAEQKLWQKYLRTFPYRILRQRPIDNFIVDFYCPSIKLVIEVDGESHFSDDVIIYDQARTEKLEGYGLQVVRFTNQEIFQNFEAVCERIEKLIALG